MNHQVQPIVLAGGRSRRFGRDKLREPCGGGWLIDRPIAALREVFGPRVWIVGDCAPEVAARGDGHLPDAHPGAGPLGGIVTALGATALDVFVLAGDLPGITASVVGAVLVAAAIDADAVLGASPELEPCIGLYRRRILPVLESALNQGDRALHRALSSCQVRTVSLPQETSRNVNAPDDLSQ